MSVHRTPTAPRLAKLPNALQRPLFRQTYLRRRERGQPREEIERFAGGCGR
jgi:hypothetical protein